jgi:serine protease AprX
VASFSSSGSGGSGGTKNPDMVAPGRSVISLAVPGSFIDQTYGAAGAVTGGFLRGSSTSQATAVVSGAAALVLQQHPTWTNNQVKAVLTLTASQLKVGLQTDAAQGRGTLNLTNALAVTSAATGQAVTSSTGTATLELARGSAHLVDNGVVLNGEKDIFGDAVSTATLASKRTAGTAWTWGYLERPHVVRGRLVRQHLVQRRLELIKDPHQRSGRRDGLSALTGFATNRRRRRSNEDWRTPCQRLWIRVPCRLERR